MHDPSVSLKPGKAPGYTQLLGGVTQLLHEARQQTARSVNAILTATYWEIGRRIVEFEQQGKTRAAYGQGLLERLSRDLTRFFGRGFSERNLDQMRLFYTIWPIPQTVSAESRLSIEQIPETVSRESERSELRGYRERKRQTVSAVFAEKAFPLSWSHYVRLLAISEDHARTFYETEALQGGWSVRQLDRQISSQFYERLLLSKNKAGMLQRAGASPPGDRTSPDEEIKDPTVLEFLNLKDEYSESELEEALIHRLEDFLLEMGNAFAFVARQKKICIGGEWYRIDLLLYHRKLRCLVILELKTGKFSHADVGQINLYLNYAREHLTLPDENPPVGVILCAERNEAVVHYALGGLHNKVLASRYRLQLPKEHQLRKELQKVRQQFQKRKTSTLHPTNKNKTNK